MVVEFMRLALEEGLSGVEAGDGGPFGAVVVKDGSVIAQGHNMVLCSNDPTAHAEVVAIRKASQALGKFDLSGCMLYTSCFPCPMCLGASLWARLDRVFYASSPKDAASVGFDDQNFHNFVRNPNENGTKLLEHLPVEGSMELFAKWTQKEEKKMY